MRIVDIEKENCSIDALLTKKVDQLIVVTDGGEAIAVITCLELVLPPADSTWRDGEPVIPRRVVNEKP
jgi:hypothetical protein